MREPTRLIKKTAELREMEELDLEELVGGGTAPPPDAGYGHAESEVRLGDYWRSVLKHRWMIVSITLIVTLLAAIYMARKPDIYEAEARVQVDLEDNPAVGYSKGGAVIVSNPVNDPAYFNTQLEILTGSDLLRRVVKTLDLEHNHAFNHPLSGRDPSTIWQNLQRMVGLRGKNQEDEKSQATNDTLLPRTVAPSTPSDDLVEAKRLHPYVKALQNGLSVQPVKMTGQAIKDTRLIDIGFTHSDPQIAAKIVNAVINTFVLSNLERKTETNATAGDFLQARIAELQAQIRTGEERLINYAKSNQILPLEAGQNTVVERLAGLNKALLEAENERIMAETAYRASLAPGAAHVLAADANKDASDAESKLAQLLQERTRLLSEYTEEWPAVKVINQQIAELEKQIQDAHDRANSLLIARRETNYRQAVAREQALRAAFDQQRGETLAQNEAAISYRITQQEIETNKSLLAGLLQRYKENDVILAGTSNNIHVIDHALVPESPVGPRRLLGVGVAFILALGLGTGLALFLEHLDNSIRSTDDVEKILHLPALAVIPTVGGSSPLPAGSALQRRHSHQALLSNVEAPAPLGEAYRQLRTSVLLSTARRPPKTLLVASSLPNEGKTTTAINIAISLAQTGADVLIIDADMRRPCLHVIFDLKNHCGLTSILSSEIDRDEVLAMIKRHEVTGLHVLTAGPVPPNPAELLGSEQMSHLIAILEAKFRYVVIDSPPVAPFTDSVLISSIVDGVLLVVHGGKSSRKVVRRSQKLLQEVGAKILGVVLNKIDLHSHDYSYYDSYYQYYGAEANTGNPVSDAR